MLPACLSGASFRCLSPVLIRIGGGGVLGGMPTTVPASPLEMRAQESGRFVGDADDLVCSLAIEFEIQFGLRTAIVPVREGFEFGSPEAAFREAAFNEGPGSNHQPRLIARRPEYVPDRSVARPIDLRSWENQGVVRARRRISGPLAPASRPTSPDG